MTQLLRTANAFLTMLPDGDLALFLADCPFPPRMACAATAAAVDWSARPVPVVRFYAAELDATGLICETEIVALAGFLHELDPVLALVGHVHLAIFDSSGRAGWAHTFPYIPKEALRGQSACAVAINMPVLPEQMPAADFDNALARSGNAMKSGIGRDVVHYSPMRLVGALRPAATTSPTLDMATMCQPLPLRTTMLDAFLTTWNGKLQSSNADPAIKAAINDTIQTGRRKARATALLMPRSAAR